MTLNEEKTLEPRRDLKRDNFLMKDVLLKTKERRRKEITHDFREDRRTPREPRLF